MWRLWPRQIASDLRRFWHVRIADWHRGILSSFEFLEMLGASIRDDPKTETRLIRVDFAPEDGAIADAMRGGERPEWKRMLAQVANETAVLRASQVEGIDSDEYGSHLFLPMATLRDFEAEEQQRDEIEREISEPAEPGGLRALWEEAPSG